MAAYIDIGEPRTAHLACRSSRPMPAIRVPQMRATARHRTGTERCGSIGGWSAGPMGKVSSVVRHYPSPHDSQRRNGADAIHFRLGDPLDLSPRCAGVFTGYGTPSRRERRCWRLVVGRSDGPAHRYRSLVFYAAERSTVTLRENSKAFKALASQQKPHGSNRHRPAPSLIRTTIALRPSSLVIWGGGSHWIVAGDQGGSAAPSSRHS